MESVPGAVATGSQFSLEIEIARLLRRSLPLPVMTSSSNTLFFLRAMSYIRIRKFICSPRLPRVTVDAVRPRFLSYVHIVELMS